MLAAEWTEIVVTLGTTVREVRKLLGLSQQQLANQAVVSQGTISRMEAGGCAEIPFHSVVVVLRTLANAATALDIPLSPTATQLLAFAPAINGGFNAIEPDPDLAYIARAIHRVDHRRRPAFLAILRAVVAGFAADEPAPSATPDEDRDDDDPPEDDV